MLLMLLIKVSDVCCAIINDVDTNVIPPTLNYLYIYRLVLPITVYCCFKNRFYGCIKATGNYQSIIMPPA